MNETEVRRSDGFLLWGDVLTLVMLILEIVAIIYYVVTGDMFIFAFCMGLVVAQIPNAVREIPYIRSRLTKPPVE